MCNEGLKCNVAGMQYPQAEDETWQLELRAPKPPVVQTGGSMQSENPQLSLRYVADSELNLDGGTDLLATKPYVDVLERTVLDCTPPFTIGLFGSWGTGKSSVAATLCKRIDAASEQTGVATFTYDAWKYSGDAFYRAFLLQLRSRFSLVGDDLYDEFYKDSTADVGHEVVASKSFAVALASWLPMILLILWLMWAQPELETAVLVALLGAAITVLAQVTRNAFITYTVTVNRPRTFAPEQFAEAFNAAIGAIIGQPVKAKWFKRWGGTKLKRLVIVVDNIDRCDGQTAGDLLLNIKNFLEREDVVFLLPLDPDAVKRFLDLGEPQASEYLRKIFTASITMKTFTTSELFDYAQDLNETNGLGLPPEAVSLACQEFATNPRRIIQFLNTLQNEVALATAQETDGHIDSGVVSGNVAFLAKLLVLREEWPDFFAGVCAEGGLLARVNEAIKHGKYQPHPGNPGQWSGEGVPLLETGLYRFLMRSQTMTADALDPFVVNKDVFRGVPDSLNELVVSQSWDEIVEGIKAAAWSLKQVVDLALRIGDRDLVQRNLMLTSGYNVLGLFGAALSDSTYNDAVMDLLGETEVHRIAAMCELRSVEQVLDKFNPSRLVALARFLLERGHPTLATRAVAHVRAAFTGEGSVDPAPRDLLTEMILGMADHADILAELAVPFGIFAATAPVEAAALIAEVPEAARVTVLSELAPMSLLAWVEGESPHESPHDEQRCIDAVFGLLREARSAEHVSGDDIDALVTATARRMEQEPDLDSRETWLQRIEGWIDEGSGSLVLGELAAALDPLIAPTRLASGSGEGLLAVRVADRLIQDTSADLPQLENRLAEVATSDDLNDELSGFATESLIAAVRLHARGWPFVDAVFSVAESLQVNSNAFARAAKLLGAVIDSDSPANRLDDAQIQRLASIVCREGVAETCSDLLASALMNEETAPPVTQHVLDLPHRSQALTAAIWRSRPESRVTLLDQALDTYSSTTVQATITGIAATVDRDSLGPSLADYVDTLRDPMTAAKVVRGVLRSRVVVPRDRLSAAMFRGIVRSDRTTAIQILDRALGDELAGLSDDDWKTAAKGLDIGSLGKKQQATMKKARKVLKYMRAREAKQA